MMKSKGFLRKAVLLGKYIKNKVKEKTEGFKHPQSTEDYSRDIAFYSAIHRSYFPVQEPYEFDSLRNVSYQHYKRARDLDSRGRLTNDVHLIYQALQHYNLSSRLTPSVAVVKEDRDLLKSKFRELFIDEAGKQALTLFEIDEEIEEKYRDKPDIYTCDVCNEMAGKHETVCMKCGFPLMDEEEFDKEKIEKLKKRVEKVEGEKKELEEKLKERHETISPKKKGEKIPKKVYIHEKIGEANELFGNDSYREALKIYEKIIEIKPDIDDAEALFNMAFCYNEIGEKDKALEYYRKSIDLNPRDDVALFNMALNLEELGRNEEALDYFNRASELNPKDKDVKRHKKRIEKELKQGKRQEDGSTQIFNW